MTKDHSALQLVLMSLLATCVTLRFAEHPPLLARDRVVAETPHERAVRRYAVKQAALRDSIVRVALSYLGTPYALGGVSPTMGFDCSGFVRHVFAQIQLMPPRTARQQARVGAPIERERLHPGDILTFGRTGGESHVGIYIGDGKFVHASSVAGRVIVSPLNRPPAKGIRPLAGARRLLAPAEHLLSRGG